MGSVTSWVTRYNCLGMCSEKFTLVQMHLKSSKQQSYWEVLIGQIFSHWFCLKAGMPKRWDDAPTKKIDYFQTAFANPCVNSNRVKKKKKISDIANTHLCACTFACSSMSRHEPSDWAFLLSARRRRRGRHGGPRWHGDNGIIVTEFVSARIATHLWGQIICQMSAQPSEHHRTQRSCQRELHWRCDHCNGRALLDSKRRFWTVFPIDFNSVYHFYPTPIWILITISSF